MGNNEQTKNTNALPADLRKAVETIKTAILQGQYEAAKGVNRIQLAVYFSIGKYVSQNSRKGVWGTGALETISGQLRRELPGLRGYSATQLREMRLFYEEWNLLDPKSSVATDEFKTSYLGQLMGYLTILDEKVRKPHENASIGIVLCKSANCEYVEFMIRDYSKPMGVATYKTADEMPEQFRKALPDQNELIRLMQGEDKKNT